MDTGNQSVNQILNLLNKANLDFKIKEINTTEPDIDYLIYSQLFEEEFAIEIQNALNSLFNKYNPGFIANRDNIIPNSEFLKRINDIENENLSFNMFNETTPSGYGQVDCYLKTKEQGEKLIEFINFI